MKWLIVNADDLGVSQRRNAGILEAHRRGIVTSASLMAFGAGFRDALRLARDAAGLDLGLHLNLSEGEPCVLGHKTLVDEAGKFFGKKEARRRAREGRFDPTEVERETEAQIRTLQDAGVRLTHIDGHQHLHIYGNLPEPIARAAARRGIRCFRCPADSLVPVDGIPEDRRAEIEEYRTNALTALEAFARHRMRSTEHFGGIGLSGILGYETLIDALQSLPEGVTELMVHPGNADAARGFSGPERERELMALTHPSLKERLSQWGIELTHFGKI